MTDNAFMELFSHTMKTERMHDVDFADTRTISRHIWSYIPSYNSKRMHCVLGYFSPKEYELNSFLLSVPIGRFHQISIEDKVMFINGLQIYVRSNMERRFR